MDDQAQGGGGDDEQEDRQGLGHHDVTPRRLQQLCEFWAEYRLQIHRQDAHPLRMASVGITKEPTTRPLEYPRQPDDEK